MTDSSPIGYIIGIRDETGSREAAFWRVFPDLESCTTERRREYRDPLFCGDHHFDCELWWPRAESGPDHWYIALAEYSSPHARKQVAHDAFRATLTEAQQDIDELRQQYPTYAARVSRFLVCEIREAQQ